MRFPRRSSATVQATPVRLWRNKWPCPATQQTGPHGSHEQLIFCNAGGAGVRCLAIRGRGREAAKEEEEE